MKYRYPNNLEAAPMIALWRMNDLIVALFTALASALILFTSGSMLPAVLTAAYLALSIQYDGNGGKTVFSLLLNMWRFLITKQARYFWKSPQ